MPMRHLLFMQVTEPRSLSGFLAEYWPVVLPALLGFLAIYLLLPRPRGSWGVWGGVCGAAALVTGGVCLIHWVAPWPEAILFYCFAGLAILAGGLMITQSNPVYAALSFALVVLSTCGLFLLQAAPFLMAATIIIYAGAIVVTFLFVIMLAQQEGYSSADLRSREPFLGTLAGFVLMGATLCTVQRAMATPELDRAINDLNAVVAAGAVADADYILGSPAAKGEPRPRHDQRLHAIIETAHRSIHDDDDPIINTVFLLEKDWQMQEKGFEPLKKHAAEVAKKLEEVRTSRGTLAQGQVPGKPELKAGVLPHRNVEGLGRVLFTDYLVPVELAGVLLLVATIGAIVIATRHSEVLR